jgi:acyl-CoA hydrolase
MEGRKVSESQSVVSQVMMPNDANNLGNVFGGVILSLVDHVAGVAAIRHARQPCVTVSMDQVVFKEPIHLGELVTAKASVNYTGHTSMEVGVYVEAENVLTGVRRHTNSCYVTYVAVDAMGRPVPVPPIIPETDVEKGRYAAGEARRKHRLAARKAQEKK